MPRCPRSRAERQPERRGCSESGAAVVDVVLVSVVLVPLVLGLIQVALVLHVRNTLVAAAGEGARYGATIDRGPSDGVKRTRMAIRTALADRYAEHVSGGRELVDGVPTVVVHVRASVPALGLWGPGVALDVEGHAVQETLP